MDGWLDGLLGRILSRGVELPIGNGLNFVGSLRADRNQQTNYVEVSVEDGGIGIEALASSVDNVAPTFLFQETFDATGASGVDRDVVIWNGSSPFPGVRVVRAWLRLSTAASGNAALRSSTGGGGSVRLPDVGDTSRTFAANSTGVKEDNAGAMLQMVGGSTLVLRLDRSCVGQVNLLCEKYTP